MEAYKHLPLQVFKGDIEKSRKPGGFFGYIMPEGREKGFFSQNVIEKADVIVKSHDEAKKRFEGKIEPSLIYEIEFNQGVNLDNFEKTLISMDIHILSVAENKKRYWVVFSDDENLTKFKRKINEYGSPKGHTYDFFNAIDSIKDIPKEEKIGENLAEKPLTNIPDFIDLELWRINGNGKNQKFISELKNAYPDANKFKITDELITKSFVLLRVKLTKAIFDEIIELKEIARAERPSLPFFNPFNYKNIDIESVNIETPTEDAAGILIIDSGIISSHPLLAKCIGDEQNFQSGEIQRHDTVGHGTAVAGCAVYGDVKECIDENKFTPSNWIFSAKVMYAEKDFNGVRRAIYDPEKLLEHQFKDAIEFFLLNQSYNIRIVNISLGNSNEIWHKNYLRQLPLASLIDELAYSYPDVLFIVSAGNQNIADNNDSIDDIKQKYPRCFLDDPDFKIINPATAALAITVGSICDKPRFNNNMDNSASAIRVPIADKTGQPSPFTRSGPGINGMLKPELVHYGGNIILYNNIGNRISYDDGGKIELLNNTTTDNLIKYDFGTSYAAPKIAHIAGQIANAYPNYSGNFIANMLLSSAYYPFLPDDSFYKSEQGKAFYDHLNICGYGIPSLEKAINSFDNYCVLFEEDEIQINTIKVFTVQLPEIFFNEQGKKTITVTLSFLPPTRSTRGDSYLGNTMEFRLFHSVDPQKVINKYGLILNEDQYDNDNNKSEKIDHFEIKLEPNNLVRKLSCRQKAWKIYKRKPDIISSHPISLVLINRNKWVKDIRQTTKYCISVIFEHEKEIKLYNQLRASIQGRMRVR